ncbi:hypothetical protein H1W00_00780 [Aeromicrobium sp. Marseille-Q0843]|uniref:Bacterial Ig-like domain-containing protein n=1 Tax=Aeromicrobium phoceense TaxID=2754045 RepID=A0A838X662_9ACTN|nr:hypothetical protein [Aeromicrobium phoceense]MBA4607009.1 hypothetical protein [Aeromicrobium phoceense]
MKNSARAALVAVLGLVASLLMAPAVAAPMRAAAAPVTISGNVTGGDFDLATFASIQQIRVDALALVGGRWEQVGSGVVRFPEFPAPAEPEGTFNVTVDQEIGSVRLKFHQGRCHDDFGHACDEVGGGVDIPAPLVQTTYWDGSPLGTPGVEDATPIDVSEGDVSNRNITLTRSKKVRATVRPAVVGAALPGQVLAAQPGTWVPAASSVDLTWMIGSGSTLGEYDMPAGTGRTFRVTTAHVGASIALRAEPNVFGYESPILQTPYLIVRARSALAVKAKAGKRTATVTIAVKAPGAAKSRMNGKASIYAKGKRIKTVNVKNGKATIKIAKQKKGKRTYTVRYSGNWMITSSSKSLKIAIR